jgi:hypothetical protein
MMNDSFICAGGWGVALLKIVEAAISAKPQADNRSWRSASIFEGLTGQSRLTGSNCGRAASLLIENFRLEA